MNPIAAGARKLRTSWVARFTIGQVLTLLLGDRRRQTDVEVAPATPGGASAEGVLGDLAEETAGPVRATVGLGEGEEVQNETLHAGIVGKQRTDCRAVTLAKVSRSRTTRPRLRSGGPVDVGDDLVNVGASLLGRSSDVARPPTSGPEQPSQRLCECSTVREPEPSTAESDQVGALMPRALR